VVRVFPGLEGRVEEGHGDDSSTQLSCLFSIINGEFQGVELAFSPSLWQPDCNH
jgi:hypothetical protein